MIEYKPIDFTHDFYLQRMYRNCEDGPEVAVILIERYIRLMDDNADILRNMANLSNFNRIVGNMRHDPASHGPIVPLLP